jgi:hypothetical protein
MSLQKPKPKNPIKFSISLNSEQKEAKEKILNSKITFFKRSSWIR